MVNLTRPSRLSGADTAALSLSLAHLGSGPHALAARRALRHLVHLCTDEVSTETLATLTAPVDRITARRARVAAAAITERRVVHLWYRDASGGLSVRDIEPVTCLVHRDHWYLVAWCRLRQGIRAFRFDRMLAVEPTDVPARPHRTDRFLPFQPRAA